MKPSIWYPLTASWFSIKALKSEPPLDFDAQKRYDKQKACNVETWTEETLTVSKIVRIITEIILLLKYQQQKQY